MADDLPAELDFSKLTPVLGRGIFAGEKNGGTALIAKYVIADESSLTCTLEDERKITVPLGWYPRLGYATPAERNDWRLIMGGRAVNWRTLGLAISMKALFEGTKANESAASLKKWLAGRGAR
jgi:hypothetical protein